MHTRNGLMDRLLDAVAIRPAAPGLVLVAALLTMAALGWSGTSAVWFWPACATLVVLVVGLNTAREDFWRRVAGHEHKQRMSTANALLNEHPTAGPDDEISGSIRELGGLVERVGRRLDDLLAEVHAENRSSVPKARRS
jgi:hypothetical protein